MELQETWGKYYNKFTEIKPLLTEKQKELSDLSKVKNAIFLAGPCPRKDSEDDWRDDKAYKILNNLEFDGTILNPTNRFFSNTDLGKQTDWESEAMHKASAIVFSLDKSEAIKVLRQISSTGCGANILVFSFIYQKITHTAQITI